MLLNPDRFIREHELTVWFSVPTVGVLMKRFGAMKPRRYPSLRWSLFCGEPLPVDLAEAWIAAAPASELENLYGPTELTVACTAYRWDPAAIADGVERGTRRRLDVRTQGCRRGLLTNISQDVAPGDVGELLMAGPQRTPGYWRDRRSDGARVRAPAGGKTTCTTGRATGCVGPVGDGPLRVRRHEWTTRSRSLGHRVELGEVEVGAAPGARRARGGRGWVAKRRAPVPPASSRFVTGSDIDVFSVRARVRATLQAYAVPQTIRVLRSLPQNANGKVDRQALLRLLDE